MAPDLVTVQDLAKYPDVFVDADEPSMGRVYGAIPGWAADVIMRNKYEFNNLDETFKYFSPGSDAALSAAFTAAYEKGEAIVGYYWEPTWLMGLYDFTLLEDYPYTDVAAFEAGETELPPMDITVGARVGFDEDFPEFIEFAKKYNSTSELTSSALAYMQDTGAGYKEAAIWFIGEHSDMISAMMPTEQWEMVQAATE
jgi:glycine betaine/proline transport system substrate-binding protein